MINSIVRELLPSGHKLGNYTSTQLCFQELRNLSSCSLHFHIPFTSELLPLARLRSCGCLALVLGQGGTQHIGKLSSGQSEDRVKQCHPLILKFGMRSSHGCAVLSWDTKKTGLPTSWQALKDSELQVFRSHMIESYRVW